MKTILSLKNLNIEYYVDKKFLHVVKNISFDLHEGETLAIIGESGSGKSVLTKTLVNMQGDNGCITSGELIYNGDKQYDMTKIFDHLLTKKIKKAMLKKHMSKINYVQKKLKSSKISNEEKTKLENELNNLNIQKKYILEKINSKHSERKDSKKFLTKLRGGIISNIFQDPSQALNPLLKIGTQITETIKIHQKLSKQKCYEYAIKLLTDLGIKDPKKAMKMLPCQFSGGMRQRIVIAIAISSKPKILIADEPTTALDVTTQKMVIELLKNIKKIYNIAIIFITHDLGVVYEIADRIAIMYFGQIVEQGTTKEIFTNSQHPYTWGLICSLPQLAIKGEPLFSIPGVPPSLSEFNKDIADPFAPRNKYALDIDFLYEPPVFQLSKTHFAKTWLLHKFAPKITKPKQLEKLKNFYLKRRQE